MDIESFISNFQNHPILFVGTGLSLRYLNNSFSWENLLKEISNYISNNTNHFYDLKNEVYDASIKEYDFPKLATLISRELDEYSKENNDDEMVKIINNEFYYYMMNCNIKCNT